MEMAYRDRWAAEIAEMRRLLAGFTMTEERKWGKPTYTVDGKNIVILQGFKEYFALGYLYHFGGAKQSATRVARIEKATKAIFEGRGFLERGPGATRG